MIKENATHINPIIILDDGKLSEVAGKLNSENIGKIPDSDLLAVLVHNTGEIVRCLMSIGNNLAMLVNEMNKLGAPKYNINMDDFRKN